MSDQFTAPAVTKAALNKFCWRLLRKSDLRSISASERAVCRCLSLSDRSGSSSMFVSMSLEALKYASKILPAGEKSVHAGGTLVLDYCRYGLWLTFGVVAFRIGASVESAEPPNF